MNVLGPPDSWWYDLSKILCFWLSFVCDIESRLILLASEFGSYLQLLL
jgi:hypothetical protein